MTDKISFEDFEKLDLRVGTILKAEEHPNADKLLVLTVDLGEPSSRTICAGLKGHYKPSELVEKQAVFVTNLAPRTLRGVESNGMILAAGSENKFFFLSPDSPVAPGTKIS